MIVGEGVGLRVIRQQHVGGSARPGPPPGREGREEGRILRLSPGPSGFGLDGWAGL